MLSRMLIFLILFSPLALLQESDTWVIDDIRVTGLQRVSAGSVFAVMPVGLGDEVNKDLFKEIALSIFELSINPAAPKSSTVGRSDNFWRFKWLKTSSVVTYWIGLPGTFFLTQGLTQCNAIKMSNVCVQKATPLIYSISALVTGCG